ncbi:acyl-CoA dehydrogenase family protein [Flavobacteriaceae bacterium]|jgi:alkylation response protein AidB-like acyl-CoA dehydrogenase|nr:acyl-CoA dehydrogenase family protein [Flavobacteriaceae bacterium]MDA9572692.1 acyl-CoA dehydrogenase family protein [Flavobacteriaceae bacterium]MDB4196183.1 acyl-CoA dehydrogenase family protein [Flavobacteriaceae bacterium]MDC0497196.1 acyl-CoA dehydrogenase family protein [Flavobacteriaceae bacterium]MDC0552057.1 acyl-CoA dehydrogenase family protein [Flavobacteriaceae bacterium]
MKNKENLTSGSEFITNQTNFSNIFTPEDFTEEHIMMRESVKEFNDREIIPFRSRFEKKDYKLTEDLMRKAGEMGFLSIAVPEQYGGLGMGFVSTMLVCEYISSGSGSFSTAFGAHTGIGTMPITLYGTEEQKNKYVPKLASGEWFGAYCLTEPGAGSDANSGKTTATLSDDGDSYKINGQKMWISNAGFCSLFIVFARIENDKNITAFIVENNTENGITLGEEEHKLGIRASSTRQVFFNDTIVSKENMLANRGEGFKIAMNSLNVGRIKLGAAGIDSQRRLTTTSIEYANERKQFKTSISNFGAIKYKIAEMITNTYVGESACYRAAKDIEDNIDILVSEGMTHQEAELKGVEDFAVECSILKVAVSEDVQIAADEGLQIYGGMGFSEEAPMESYWRDARIARIYEGTNEINRMVSVGHLLKKAFKKEINLKKAITDSTINSKFSFLKNKKQNGIFKIEKETVSNYKDIFLTLIGHCLQDKIDLEKNQQLLLGLSNILIEIYMSESAVLRTEKNTINNENNFKIKADLTSIYLSNANDIINKNAKEVINLISTGSKRKKLHNYLYRKTRSYSDINIIKLRNRVSEQFTNEGKYFI